MRDFIKWIVRALWIAYLFAFQTKRFHRLATILRGPDINAVEAKTIFVARVRSLLYSRIGCGGEGREKPYLQLSTVSAAIDELVRAGNIPTVHFTSHMILGLRVLTTCPLLTAEEKREIECLSQLARLLNWGRWSEALYWYNSYPWRC